MSQFPEPDYQPQDATPPVGETFPGQLPTAPMVPAEGYQGYGMPAVQPGMYVDPQSGLILPEGVQLASHGRRIGAFFLAFPLSIVTLGIGYWIWGLIIWSRGQTPTQQLLGMRCYLPETGRVPGFWRMTLREVVGTLATGILSLISELTSFVLFLATKERRALTDMVAGTVVLHDPHKIMETWNANH